MRPEVEMAKAIIDTVKHRGTVAQQAATDGQSAWVKQISVEAHAIGFEEGTQKALQIFHEVMSA